MLGLLSPGHDQRPRAARPTTIALLLLAATPALVAQIVPLGTEWQVNEITTGFQESPDVAALSGGGFVVVWRSDASPGTDQSGASILARLFDGVGAPLGRELQVNSYTTGFQFRPRVAPAADGGFLVSWHGHGSFGTDADLVSVHSQRFDAQAMPIGDELQVNVYTTGNQQYPQVAATGGGGFVVVWESMGSFGSDSSYQSIQARRLDAGGLPVGDEFQVNSYTTDTQWHPAVAAHAAGGFEVVWESFGSPGDDSSASSIQGQRFDALGLPAGAQFQVNSYTTSYQWDPVLAFNEGGDSMVTWENYLDSPGNDDEWTSVVARIFDPSGSPTVADFQVNTRIHDYQYLPHVVADGQDGFLVVWSDNGDEWGLSDLYARRLDADGTPHAAEIRISEDTDARRFNARTAMLGPSTAVVVWASDRSPGTDQDLWSVHARIVELALFSDGFETGDTRRWSAVGS